MIPDDHRSQNYLIHPPPTSMSPPDRTQSLLFYRMSFWANNLASSSISGLLSKASLEISGTFSPVLYLTDVNINPAYQQIELKHAPDKVGVSILLMDS